MSIYLRQLVAGRDFGRMNPVCGQMENLVYLIGDRTTRQCLVVDPAWGIEEIIACAQGDDMTIVGALATHYHPDHVGGSMFGFSLEGAAKLVSLNPCKVHCHSRELEGLRKVTGLEASDVVAHDSGDKVRVGNVEVEWLHTPGHTPGSSCFRVGNALVAGDTLFLQGCGRVDLPGGDSDEMYTTLTQRLAGLPGDMVLYPGHSYGGFLATLHEVRRSNPYMKVRDLQAWRRMRG
jgi:glyoxylase-like metal-dependent hydrolase (beta-lactamase superfamily II)